MKSFLFCLIICLLLNSCSIFKSGNYDSRETEIILLKETDYHNDKLIFIYSKNEYELLVPLSKISKYTRSYNGKKLKEYTNYILGLYENKSIELKILNSKFRFGSEYSSEFHINANHLFESGEYLIYDNKNNKYIEKVLVKWESWYNGPLAAGNSYSILIGEFIFYEESGDTA